MGQTLTHGIYLPDEGERNCYNGLAGNWQLLDGAVGTIAEHTSALAGKAPLVHTHTKSDITDFPAYGTTAGTICEGNDSRLSDARAPVAHTHTKSDVTDLLNSNFIPSANNSYDLGSSSYQWNNLYAKNYYYNGVAWGLDKANVWSAHQKIVGNNSRGTVSIYNQAYTKGSALSSTDLSIGSIYMGDGGQTGLENSLSFISTDLAGNGARTLLSLSSMENTASSRARTNVIIQYDKNDAENPRKVTIQGSILPHANATYSLGTSTAKWKTLNGINPGALSLPNLSRKSSILEYITDLTGGLQYYTPLADGWICIQADNSSATNYIRCAYDDILVKANGNGQAQGLSVLIPVLAGVQIGIRVVCTTLSSAYFYHCQGNVT